MQLLQDADVREIAVSVILLTIIVSMLRGWLVVGWQYDDVKRERDAWRQVALTGTQQANEALSIAESRERERAAS